MEKNFIVLTPDIHDTHGLVTLSRDDLANANFSFNMPFCLYLNQNETLICERVIRILPKKRMVVYGIWRDQSVVAKLFFDAKRASENFEKDIQGIKALQKNKIPTPNILHVDKTIDKKVHVLILEHIQEARNLQEIWDSRHEYSHKIIYILKAVIIEIATQHVLGLLQHDLHLKNFLLTEKTIYTLDGAQFEIFPHLLDKGTSIKNLALLLSQLGVEAEKYQKILYEHYAKARGWTQKQEDLKQLFFQINKWNEIRWNKYAKKIERNCTQFASFKSLFFHGVYDRKYADRELVQFVMQADHCFHKSMGKILKAGNSATVIKVQFDKKFYVIKRYNIKNKWHFLRRCLRTTRALSNWRLAQKLNLFGIATAKPVAFIEQRFLGIRRKSYYITEYVSEMNASDYFIKFIADKAKTASMIKNISDLLQNMAKIEVTHGDLKITNVLIDDNDKPVIIDLDGAAEYFSLAGLKKAWDAELERFLRNFDSNPGMRKKFEAEFNRW